MKHIVILLSYCVVFCVVHDLALTQVKEKAIQSLRKMFGETINITSTKIILSVDEKKQIFEKAKTAWSNDTLSIFVCALPNKKVVGYGFIDDVKGKVQFITYLVGVNPSGDILDVDVLSYREAYGGEIMYESFRKQFRNKTASDQLYPGKDIKNISGATISVRAITLGVKRILTTFELIHNRIQ